VTGYGIIEKNGSLLAPVAWGTCRTRGRSSFPDRLQEIFLKLQGIIEEHRPDAVAVERVFLSKNPSSALKLGESRGVALLAAAHRSLPVFEYSTREVKQAVTGYGGAPKDQIQKMLCRLLNLTKPASHDASDALAVALCHLQSFRLREISQTA